MRCGAHVVGYACHAVQWCALVMRCTRDAVRYNAMHLWCGARAVRYNLLRLWCGAHVVGCACGAGRMWWGALWFGVVGSSAVR